MVSKDGLHVKNEELQVPPSGMYETCCWTVSTSWCFKERRLLSVLFSAVPPPTDPTRIRAWSQCKMMDEILTEEMENTSQLSCDVLSVLQRLSSSQLK